MRNIYLIYLNTVLLYLKTVELRQSIIWEYAHLRMKIISFPTGVQSKKVIKIMVGRQMQSCYKTEYILIRNSIYLLI